MTEMFVESQGGVATLTLDRPDRRNALSDELVRDALIAVTELQADPTITCIILTGSPPGFCAGSDLYELAGMSDSEMVRHELRTAHFARYLGQIRVPVIAAVEGFAIGGGLFLALSCDLVVASKTSKWSAPEVGHGWIPPWGIDSLITKVGLQRAKRMLLGLQDGFTDELGSPSLADLLAEEGQALDAAQHLAARISLLSPRAVAAVKRYVNMRDTQSHDLGDELSAGMFSDNIADPQSIRTFDRFRSQPRESQE